MKTQLILNEPIANGLDIIGDRWTLLILREAFYGRTRFEEFHLHTGASRSTLTRRLNSLVKNRILYKHPHKDSSKRKEYRFTELGLSLLGPSLMAARWEADWHVENQADISENLFHTVCGHHMSPQAICRSCKLRLQYEDVQWQAMELALDSQLEEIRACNTKHRKSTARQQSAAELNNPNLASLIGDRWSILILIAAFLGTCKYDDFTKQLNIPPSILAERLKFLVVGGIFERESYQTNPARYAYRLTDKGKSLFPFVMTLRQWVTETLPDSEATASLVHRSCGAPLIIDVVCGVCHQKPWPSDLRFSLHQSPK